METEDPQLTPSPSNLHRFGGLYFFCRKLASFFPKRHPRDQW
nr:MAG TPA: hypothetical protein [Caudoviricetes sp.]